SPLVLNSDYSLIKYPKVFFAGQITGVEGYVESASSGMIAGINAARKILGKESIVLPASTCSGALIKYITDRENKKFQPMNANFGIIEWERVKIKNKKERYEYISSLALKKLEEVIAEKNNPSE
ncbi:MAG: FAD-dependent oxidoreductase, partial [Clostridia bacterium]|nr:FAD-dependent oxidoreductase [Clostridia bacterium]